MNDRIGRVERKTRETEVVVTVRIDGSGEANVETGIGFFDHMLELFGRHSLMDIIVKAKGDIQIDEHHTVEDVGIVMGQALLQALGDKRSIQRFAVTAAPLDEALTRVNLDISGRGGFYLHGAFPREKTGGFDAFMAEDFFRALSQNAGLTVHMELVSGSNPHHVVETAFKALALSLKEAVTVDHRISGVPSTKGSL
ncbi:TPA: imidazoleglycerol-phosphate dehydratase HisB [bacterium]|nr:MAG: imidazoleglycerol-phosphate dehydratase HisB [Candidatus Hydrogenedentes bacterium CG07_land_8_20_14_0_80_42_17]HBW46872.1 imidazoleglycerol-phosphate dehydratase HisB [bacterium]